LYITPAEVEIEQSKTSNGWTAAAVVQRAPAEPAARAGSEAVSAASRTAHK
jgi:hypothetical protein